MIEIRTVEAPGGRALEFLLAGDNKGRALVCHHGTPTDATLFAGWDDAFAARGLRLVAPTRPGYGGSSRHRGRTVADAAADTALVLDTLGQERFHTLGWSGGGPHALASAARLVTRCDGVAVLAGVGPHAMDGVDFLAGMGPENVAEFGAAEAGEDALCHWFTANAAGLRSVTGAEIAASLGGLIPEADRALLRGAYAEDFAATTRRALGRGFDGWIDDDLAFVRPWGFALDDVRAPTTFWQGALDLMVPAAHGRWLAAHTPGATLEFTEGDGHLSLVAHRLGDILDRLTRA